MKKNQSPHLSNLVAYLEHLLLDLLPQITISDCFFLFMLCKPILANIRSDWIDPTWLLDLFPQSFILKLSLFTPAVVSPLKWPEILDDRRSFTMMHKAYILDSSDELHVPQSVQPLYHYCHCWLSHYDNSLSGSFSGFLKLINWTTLLW